MKNDAKNPVETTKKSFRLIEELKNRDGAGVTELANELEMSKTVVHNHLSTLVEEGYVINSDGQYSLSLKLLELGGYVRKQHELYEVAEPEINDLAKDTGELVNLAVEEYGQVVYLYRAKGDNAVDVNTYAGLRTHVHCTALGKAIMAYLPESRVDQIIDAHGLPEMTPRTTTDREQLFDELEDVRNRGYAVDMAERLEGLHCIAVPIQGDDTPLGAISVSAPASRMPKEKIETTVHKSIKDTANVIELNMRY